MAKQSGSVSGRQSFRRLVGWWLANTDAEALVQSGLWEDYLAAREFYANALTSGVGAATLETTDYEFLLAADGVRDIVGVAEAVGISSMAARGKFKKLWELGLVGNKGGKIGILPWGQQALAVWEANGREVV